MRFCPGAGPVMAWRQKDNRETGIGGRLMLDAIA
jgi:hypothetical protein